MRIIFSFMLCLLVCGAQAATVSIDFEDADRSLINNAQDPSGCNANLTVIHDGFSFANPGLCGAYAEYLDSQGSNSIGLYFAATDGQQGASVTMTQNNGQRFDLLSMDMLRGASSYMKIAGFRDGQEVYFEALTMTGFIEEKIFNWTNLDSVMFIKNTNAPNSIGFDNLAVTAVPLPTAVWLFGSALAGLGWMRRKSTA